MAKETNDYTKDWDEHFSEWRKQKGGKQTEFSKVEKKIERAAEKKISEIEKETKEVEHRIDRYVKTTPFHVRALKFLVVFIPVFIVLYLIGANFLVAQNFEYIYDVGGGESYLTPSDRVSLAGSDGSVNYRNLTSHLVYFDVPMPNGAEKINVKVKFKDNFPENGLFSLGARDNRDWHYVYRRLYNPALTLSGNDKKGNVYRMNKNLPLVDETGLKNLNGITIAADNFPLRASDVAGYTKAETVIDEDLRGKHTFYIYASDDLNVSVEKQDINWYEGSDEMYVSLYDSDGILVDMVPIADDGNTKANNLRGFTQKASLNVDQLTKGVYKLELSDFDGLVTNIKINSNKVVTDKVFLAGNGIYGVETKPGKLYFTYSKDETLKLTTYHREGLQNIAFNREGVVENYNFNVEDEPVYKGLTKGNYEATFPKNDIVVESPEYFAFTPDGYFRPWKQKVVSLDSPEWILKGVDYVVMDSSLLQHSGDWLISETNFDVVEDKLFVTDKGTVSFVFNTPHLVAGNNRTIPIDWIKVNVYKPGVFG